MIEAWYLIIGIVIGIVLLELYQKLNPSITPQKQSIIPDDIKETIMKEWNEKKVGAFDQVRGNLLFHRNGMDSYMNRGTSLEEAEKIIEDLK